MDDSSLLSPPLFPYQLVGADWLSKRKTALLADDMGLGKTAQAIRATDIVNAERILVLCPAVARINWLREFKKFSKHSRDWIEIREMSCIPQSRQCAVSSYDLAMTSAKSWPGHWECLILDEAHFLKNPEAKRTKEIFGKDGLVHRSKRIWALTGTPAPNHAGELWVLLFTFGLTKLPYTKFIEKFCNGKKTTYGFQIEGTKKETMPEVKQMLKQCMLRRKKEEVMLQLPPITYSDISVEAGNVDLDTHDSFVGYVFPTDRSHELFEKLDKQKRLLHGSLESTGFSAEGMKILEALAPSISTLRMYTGMQKLEPTAKLLKDELESNAYQKIVVFAHHQGVIEGLRTALKDFHPLTLYGGTPPEKRQSHIDKFQKEPKFRIFIANIKAAGTSITLTAADQVLVVEPSYVPGDNAQAIMRVHRVGQTNPVFVRFVGLRDSMDDRISHILKRKTRELTELFDL